MISNSFVIFNFLFGFLWGIVYRWNNKVFFGLVIMLSMIVLIGSVVVSKKLDEAFSLFRLFVGIVVSMIGSWTGIYFYDCIFEDGNRDVEYGF